MNVGELRWCGLVCGYTPFRRIPYSRFAESLTLLQTLTLTNMQFRLTNSQRYLVDAKPDTNHSTKPTNLNGNSKR